MRWPVGDNKETRNRQETRNQPHDPPLDGGRHSMKDRIITIAAYLFVGTAGAIYLYATLVMVGLHMD